MGVNVNVLLTEIEFAYRHLKKYSYPGSSLPRQGGSVFGKDNLRATKQRNLGNAMYQLYSDDRQALLCYTLSVAEANDNSEELALAYANRSAALFRIAEYVPCLLDINRALKGQYPEHLRNKLQDRKKKCLIEIAKMGMKIKDVCNETDSIDSTSTATTSNKSNVNFDNPFLANASSKIELAYDEKWGRHMVAVQDIEPGEILSYEQFFVTFLHRDQLLTHCSYCSVRCAALIPCPSCSQAMYCSQSCLTRAFNAYHRTECKMWPFFEDESPIALIKNWSEALRMLLVGTEQGSKLRRLTASLHIRDIFQKNVNPVNKSYPGDYLSILQLRLTFDQPSKELVMLAVKAMIWLQRFPFFENHPDSNFMSEAEFFVTLALLNHLQSISRYNFSIFEMSNLDSNLAFNISAQKIAIRRGIIALHSLVNHSCNPNVNNITTREREQIIFSTRPIKQGEQIFLSYCSSFAVASLAERRRKLSLYGFTCCCEACTNDWPVAIHMLFEEPKFFINDAKEILKIMKMIGKMMETGVKDINIQNLIRWRKLIHDYICPPNYFANLCEDMILKCMMRTYSNLCYANDAALLGVKSNVALDQQMFVKFFENLSNNEYFSFFFQ